MNIQKYIVITQSPNISLRGILRKNNLYSLILDINYNSERYRETLNLFISTSNKRLYTAEDMANLKLANAMKAKRENEIRLGIYPNNEPEIAIFNIIDYFKQHVEELELKKSPSIWKFKSTYKHVLAFNNNPILLPEKITVKYLDDFKDYLLNTVKKTRAHDIFAEFNLVMKKALRHDLINSNPFDKLDSRINKDTTMRLFLTLEELTLLNNTKCELENVKRAFLFSCFTGLRFVDVKPLDYSQIKQEGENYYSYVKQKKTTVPMRTKLSVQALTYLDFSSGNVFNLPNRKKTNKIIDSWVKKAEITKKITYNIARHTFATLSLTYGVDIYTLKNLMGHKSVKTTEIYAKIIDATKDKAIEMLPKL